MLRQLHHPDAATIKRIQHYEIWHLLLLVKWTVLYGSPSDKYGIKPVTDYEFAKLMNKLKDLSAYMREFNSLGEFYLFTRAMAFQQLWFPRKEYISFDSARQYLLFGRLDKNHAFQDWFKRATNVSILDFLELSWGLFARVLGDTDWSVNKSYFSAIADKYEDGTVSRFLDAFSHSVLGARTWLQRHDAEVPESVQGIEYEYFTPSPFARYPLIRQFENYYVIST